jgi:hypothetical protein
MTQTELIKSLADKWQAPIVVRHEVGKFSGGLLNPRTMANRDSAGTGVAGRFKIGKKTVYPVDSLVQFLIEMATATKAA